MQPTPGGRSSSGGGGSGELSGGGGLARFRSAPATWLEALLEEEKPVDQKEQKKGNEEKEEEEEEDEDEEDPLKPTQSLTQLLASSADPSLLVFDSNIFRQNSSPAEFFGNSDSEAYFSNFGLNPNPPNYNNYDSHSNSNTFHGGGDGTGTKRFRELNHHFTAKFPSHHHLKGEQSSGGGGGVGSFIDMEMEKLLEDSVPCRVRAKRGCATHPRSIAERVRRTRISDRIRKLQDLVPNMDKQTNTADMLEEAVEYVKLLQKQIQDLSEQQQRCKCVVKDFTEESIKDSSHSHV